MGAAEALRSAEETRDELARALVLPPWFLASLGLAVAGQILTTALGFGVDEDWARIALVAGVVGFGVVAGTQLRRFRRSHGVRLGGLASRVVFGTATTASVVYGLALAGAMWAAYADAWWLVALCSIAGGAGWAVSGARWMRAYRGDPSGHSRGESALLLAALALPAVGGLVLLVVQH